MSNIYFQEIQIHLGNIQIMYHRSFPNLVQLLINAQYQDSVTSHWREAIVGLVRRSAAVIHARRSLRFLTVVIQVDEGKKTQIPLQYA